MNVSAPLNCRLNGALDFNGYQKVMYVESTSVRERRRLVDVSADCSCY